MIQFPEDQEIRRNCAITGVYFPREKKEVRESVIRMYDYRVNNAPKVELNVCPSSTEGLKSVPSGLSVSDFHECHV